MVIAFAFCTIFFDLFKIALILRNEFSKQVNSRILRGDEVPCYFFTAIFVKNDRKKFDRKARSSVLELKLSIFEFVSLFKN